MRGEWLQTAVDDYEYRANDVAPTVVGKVTSQQAGYRAECLRDGGWRTIEKEFLSEICAHRRRRYAAQFYVAGTKGVGSCMEKDRGPRD